jgi:hypothetical protein
VAKSSLDCTLSLSADFFLVVEAAVGTGVPLVDAVVLAAVAASSAASALKTYVLR